MTDPGPGGFPPPPGWQPPKPPPRTYLSGSGAPTLETLPPPPPPGSWAPAPGMLGAAHKPGAIPLRPLGLGDMFDAAFRIIRFNPKATVGSAVLVAAVTMTIPIVVTAILTATVNMTIDQAGTPEDESLVGFAGSFGSLVVGIVLFAFGSLFVTGMVAHVVSAAAVGQRLTLGDAWAATRGKRWRLVGLSLLLWLMSLGVLAAIGGALVVLVLVAESLPTGLVVVLGIALAPLAVAALLWFWVRFYLLPVPVFMLEDVGVIGAIRRAYRLSRRQFWRLFGIALLTVIVVAVASNILAAPISIAGQVGLIVGGRYALLIYIASSALAQVVSGAFATPFTAGVTTLQYLDQRMRKEAYDVELMARAGLTG